MKTLHPLPLTAEAFAPFGTVTEMPAETGTNGIAAHAVSRAFLATERAPEPVLNLVRVEAIPKLLVVTQLEIHPHSGQSFLALDGAPSLIVVCQPDAQGRPDPEALLAFIARSDQVVTYDRGVLHHRLTPLRAAASFAMAMRQTGRGEDTVLLDLSDPVKVILGE